MDIFVNFLQRKLFYTLLRNISFCSFEKARYFSVELCMFFFFMLPSATNQYRTGTFKPYFTSLWTIGFSTVTYIELWWSVIHLQKNALKIYGTHSTVDILTSDKNSVFSSNFIFPALIDDPKKHQNQCADQISGN